MIIDAHNHPDWHKHDFDAFIKKTEPICLLGSKKKRERERTL